MNEAFTSYYGMRDVKPICGDYLHDIAFVKIRDANFSDEEEKI